MLLSSAGLSSSSEADEPLFTRSAQQLERLWSGVLGCTERSESFTARNRFKDSGNANGGGVPVGNSRDYSQCGKFALRNTGSRILVDTIEDAVRSGGVALISDRFRLDSSIGWIWREGATGKIDAVVPLLDKENTDGTGHALFLQPGAVFWQGIESEDRIDANLGIAFRRHFTPDVIGGWSGFYDYDFKRKHRRLGIGMDIQSGVFHTAVNYYYPLNEWQEGRTGYEEQPLEGVDIRLGLEWPRIRLDASVAAWRFEGEIDEETKWRPSFSAEAGFHILPGIFLEAGYERQDEDSSIGSQWSTGLAFRFTLPGLDGLNAFEDSTAAPNLFEPVKREKRILYEERQELPQATLTAMPARVEEGNDVTVRVVLGKAIEENVFFSVAALSSSTADADDYDPLPSRITIPAGSTSAEATFEILDDPDSEPDEILDIELRVLQESFFFVARGDTHRARVVIEASDNSVVGFATESTYVAEGIEVHVPLVLGEPAPSDGLILVALSDKDDVVVDGEMRISPGAREGQYIRVTVNPDDIPEDAEMARIVLSESSSRLPEGWRFSRSEHMLTILPNDQTAMFAKASESFDEDAGSVSFEVTLLSDAPEGGVPLEVDITSGNDDGDVAFTTQSFVIAEGEREHTLTVDINDDDLVEPNEVVTFTLSKDASAVFPDEWGNLGTQTTFELTITDNDSTSIGFTSSSSTLTEGGTTALLTVRLNGSVSQPVEVTISESGDDNNDIEFTPTLLTFTPGETDKQVTLTVNTANNDAFPERDVEITYTLTGSLPGGVSFAAESHVVTFVDDDKTIRFRDASSSASEGTSGHPVAVVLNFDPPAEGLEVEAVSTGEHKDEVSIPSTPLNFTGNMRELSVPVDVLEDNIREDAEVVRLELQDSGGSLPEGWTLLASGNNDHDLSILPSDQTAMFAEDGKTADEGDGTITFKVMLSADAPAGGVPLEVAITSGNGNGDVIFATQRFSITEGSREHTISVDINDDNQVEPEEVVRFTLSKGASAVFPDAWGDLGTQTTFDLAITDNDSATVGFTTASSTLLESNASAVLTVSLVGSVSQDVVVTLSESGDGNNDLGFAPDSLTFAPGERSKHVTLTVNAANNDTTPERDVEITYTLAGTLPNAVTFSAREHVVTLVDDDKTVGFRESSSSAGEGTDGHSIAVVLNFDPPAGGLEVSAAVESTHILDVSIPSPTLNFTGSTRELSLLVNVLRDGLPEGAESIELMLSGNLPSPWRFGQQTHELTILLNEQKAMFAESGKTVDESDGTITFKVMLSADAPAGGVPLEVDVTSGNENNDVTFTMQSFTIIEGEREHTLTVDVNDDNLVEPDEVVTFTLSKDASAVFPDEWGDLGTETTFDLTITDDDNAMVGFASGSSTLREGDGTTTLSIMLTNPVSQDVVVTLTESGDTNNQVAFTPSLVTFTSGQTSKQVMLMVVGDNTVEEVTTIIYALTGTLPDDVSFGTQEHVVTLIDDDSATIGFTTASSTLSEGDNADTLTVSLSAEVSQDVVVTLNESGDGNNDLTFSPSSLTFTPGETDKQVTLTVNAANNDNKVEEDVDITYTLTGAFSGNVSLDASRNTHVVSFMDDDSSMVGFTSGSSTLMEGDGAATLSVVLTNPVSQDVVVTVGESGDTNNQVAFTPSSVTFTSGQTSKQVMLTVVDDNKVEPGAIITYTLTGSLPDDVTLDIREHVVTLTDDDSSTIGFTMPSSTLSEGDSTAKLTVELSDPVSQDVMVRLTESGDTNNQVAFTPSSLTFISGQTSKEITLTVVDDNTVEPGATITYTLAGTLPGNLDVSFGTQEHVVTFTDDDTSTIEFASGSSTLREDDSRVTLSVVLTNPVSEDVMVMLTESGDTNNEVAFSPSSLTFAPGDTSKEITLTVVDDNTVEPGATITYTLAGTLPGNLDVSFGTRDHVVTFIDDDSATVGFASSSSTLSESDSTGTLTVSLSAPSAQPVTVTLTEGGDDNNDIEFAPTSLTFAPRETSKQVMLTVNAVNNDNKVEEDVAITYTLTGTFSGSVGLDASRNTHVVTFTDDDSAMVGFTAPSSTLRENEGTATLSIVLTNPVSEDVVLALSESGDANDQVAFSPSSLTFASGQTSKEITLTVVDDNTVEPGATITYTLAGTLPGNLDVSFGTQDHVVTFIDDDSSTIGFTTALSTLSEGDSTTNLAVELSAPSTQLVTVTLTESGDDRNDIEFAPASLTFMPGETSKPVTLTVNASNNDNKVEEDVEITYTLTGTFSGNVRLDTSRSTHVVTFTDDDSATVGFASSSSTLSEDGTNPASLTVELSAEVSQGVVVDLTESGDGNSDLSFSPASLAFAPGETSHNVTLTVNTANNNTAPEGDVEITYTLGGTLPDDVSFGTREHVVTFIDDDKTVSFKESSSSANEGTIGHPVAVVLNFDPPAEGLEVSAVAKGDHKDDVSIPLPVLNFTGSTRELPVLVDVLDDIEQEDAEVVQLELEETSTPLPLGWTLIASGDNDHDLTIELNDRTAEFAEAGDAMNENAGTVSFRVTLSGDAPVGGVPLEVAITSGNDDGDVTFTAQRFTIAEDNREHTLTVDINDDNQVEPDEVVRFTLSKGGSFPQTWGDLGSQTTFDLTILANDGSVQFAAPFEQMVEEDAGAVMIPLDVTVAPPTDGLPLRVEIAGHGNNHYTATTDDYSFAPLAFTLMPAEAGEGYNLVFSVIDDDLPEKEETFVFTLHAGEGFPTGWGGLGEKTTRYLTIQPNDRTIGFADTLPAELREGTLNFPLEVVWNAYIEDIKDRPTSIRLGVEIEKADEGGTEPDVLLEFPPDTFNEFQDTSHDTDYLNYTGSAGSDTRIEINVRDDKIDEEDEGIVVRLVPKQGYPLTEGWSIDPAEYRFTIPANDKFIGFATADSSLVEPNGDPGAQVSGNVVVKLNGPAPVGGLNLVVSVDEETNDDGGNIDAEVTIGEGGVVFISEGATEISFPVTVLEDDIAESNEPVVLTLSKGANWPERWEIGGLTDTGNLSATHTVTILGNDKKVGWRDAVRKLVSEANYASVSPVVTNYPAPAGGLDLTVNVESHTGSYARADVRTDGSGDLSYQENVRIRPNSRFEGVNTVAPVDDGIAEPDEAAVFRLSVAGGGQLPPGWEWSNQDLEVIILANDNDFTFTDGDNDDSKGSYSEGTTVRLTAVATNPLPSPVSNDDHETFSRRVGYFGIEVTENSEDISITPVAPVIYHSYYHHPDGSQKTGIAQPIKGGQEIFADYAFTVTEGGQLESVSFDVAIHEDSKTEPPETVVITLSISGSWGLRPTTRQYTLTINDEGGTGMIGFREGEMPYGLYERASISTQRPGVLVELSSPSPPGGIDLMMLSSDPGQLLVGRNIHVPENRRGCYVTQLPVSTGSNYHFPEHRERCYFTDFNTISDGIPEGDETYDIIISEDPDRPLPPMWEIDLERSRREVTIYSSDNKVGIAGFVDPVYGEIKENVSVDENASIPARLVLDVPNNPVPGGLHLRLKVIPDTTTPGASDADLGIYPNHDFTIPRREQAGPFRHEIKIPITNDTDAEQLERFSFNLELRHASGNHNTWGNVDRNNNNATLTIRRNDQTVGWEKESVEITENETGSSARGFADLVFSSPVSRTVSFTFSVDSPLGENQNDLIIPARPVRTGDNNDRYSVALTALSDNHAEADETFIVTASPGSNFPANYTLTPSTIEVTILANDNLVGFTSTETEANEDVGTVDVTLTLTNPAPAGGLPLRIPTLTTATSDSDFTFTEYGNEFTIMPEDGLQYTFTVNIDDDDLAENTEIYDLVLEKGDGFPDGDGGWGILGQATHKLTILENDQKISWAEETVEIIEGEDKSLVLNFSGSVPEDTPARVSFRVENNSDEDISLPDLSGSSTSVIISGAQPSYGLRVVANEDMEKEDDETFMIVATGYDFPPSYDQNQEVTIEVTIPANNNNLVGFVGSSIEVEEDVGSINLTLNITGDTAHLELSMRLNISGQHQPADIGGTVSHDFTIPQREQGGSFQHVIPIPITDDDDTEDDKRIMFSLSLLDNSWGKIDKDNDKFELNILKNDQWFGFIAETSVEIAKGETEDVYLYFSSPVSHPATFMFHTDTPIDGVNFASTLTVEVEEYEMKELGGPEFHAWKFPISVTDDEITEGEQSFRLYVTPGPNVPDYYTLNPVYSYIDIIIPASDQ